MGIEDEFAAYCFDDAVSYFGNWVDAQLAKIEAKSPKDTASQQSAALHRILRGGPTFADPSLIVKKG